MINQKTTSVLLNNDSERFFGPGPAELLFGVEKHGSLLGSSKAMGMSYSKANMIIRRAEKSLGIKLLDSTTGGAGGGGSILTPQAALFLRAYTEYTDHIKDMSSLVFEDYISPVLSMVGAFEDLGIILLASGHSERFGENKLTYSVHGKALIEYILDSLKLISPFADIVVSTTDETISDIASKYGIRTKVHSAPYLSDSIRNGLEGSGMHEGYMFIQADQPLLTVSSIAGLAEMWTHNRDSVVRLGYSDSVGSPVIFPGNYRDELMSMSGETGGSSIIKKHSLKPLVYSAAAAWELWDADTKTDLKYIEDIITMHRH